MVYRGVEDGMSGYHHEWDEAKREGARAAWRSQPVAFEGDGSVERIRCAVLDENKKPVVGQEVLLGAQLVLMAIGQGKLGDMLSRLDGVTVEWGRVVTDEDGATGRPGWYAGGCLLYTSPSPRDLSTSRMPSSA